MVLEARSPSKHNIFMSQRIPHPQSTKFHDSDDFPTPTSKRVKISKHETADSDPDLEHASPTEHTLVRRHRAEILDSDDEDEEPRSKQTQLETSLPDIKTDAEAIETYEAYKAGEEENETLHSRIDKQSWIKGRSSIYVDAFNLALDTVLQEEGHLFDEAEKSLFEQWRSLCYENQYLYVRLFLRKTSAWHRIGKLGYYSDISNPEEAVVDLQKQRELPEIKREEQETPGELEPPEVASLGDNFTWAECSSEHITTLDEASSLLLLDELKGIAKDAKVQGKNKGELLKNLRATSGKQGGLEAFRGIKRSETEETYGSAVSEDDDDSQSGTSTPLKSSNRDAHFTKKILEQTGKCIRLSIAPLKLFERVHLVFYRSTEWTEKSLTTLILAKISRRNFPEYFVSRSARIFESRALLLEFEASLRTQFRVDNILEFNGPPGRKGLEQVVEIFEAVYPRWKALLAVEQNKEDRVYESGEGAYLRRFSPAWVYTRIVHKALHPIARLKEHAREHALLTELLDQRLFHAARRGGWYIRKALLEEHYMHELTPPQGRSAEAQKKHYKRVALRTCEEGLEDRECHVIYHYDLQKRIKKIEKQLKLPVREQHDFGHVLLSKPVERDIKGIQILREAPPVLRRNSSTASGNGETSEPKRLSTKTYWHDELDTNERVSVEAMCLSHYRKILGWKGYHSEGGILRTLFGLLFADIIFEVYVPNVFQTAYQTCPLDLHTDAFYSARITEINARCNELEAGNAEAILTTTWEANIERKTCIVGVRWDEYALDDLQEICRCFVPQGLATVMRVMAQEYANRGGGVPDLFLWKVGEDGTSGEVMFSEVKSENDRLSDTQRLWISVMMNAGVRVELAHAVARQTRVEVF
jgi:fanconi-associated nuclease 1